MVPLGPEAVGTDITDELLRRGLPELQDVREGVAFFHLQGLEAGAALGLEIVGGGGATAGRVVGVPIRNGQLVLAASDDDGPTTTTATAPRIRLTGASATATTMMEPSSAGGSSVAVAVTWNGDKVRAGSSHRCEVREAEVSGPRKEALDTALAELGVDVEVRGDGGEEVLTDNG